MKGGTSEVTNTMYAEGIDYPRARREDDRVILAGKVDDGLNRGPDESLLLDPPREVPDPYGWMRDESRTNKEVLDHLKAENTYTEKMTGHLSELRETIYKEFLSSIQETDYTTPSPWGDYLYYSRTFEGKSYKVLCRAPKLSASGNPGSLAAEEAKKWTGKADDPILPGEVCYMDENVLAEGKDYCGIHTVVSPSHKLVAYTADFIGGETYRINIKDIETGKLQESEDASPEMDASIEWGADDSTIYYLKMDEAHRPYQVYMHTIGQPYDSDKLLFEENDDLMWVGISKTNDEKYLIIDSASKETSEVLFLDLSDPAAPVQTVSKRREKVLYEVEHRDGKWYILTNVGGTPNMRLMSCDAKAKCEDEWRDVLGSDGAKLFDGDYSRTLDDVTPFKDHMLALGREGGIPRVWIVRFGEKSAVSSFEQLTFGETAYDVGYASNNEYETDVAVVSYNSLITPLQTIQVSVNDASVRKVLKEKAVPSYDRSLYNCERTTVLSRDGQTEIPISIVYRKDIHGAATANGETLPTHLYGYGSYGACMEASFSATRLSLLDRGMVYVIAHIRGGGEMGRQWYEMPSGAKYLCKGNTFDDFVDVARHLIDSNRTEASKLSCEGRSAGGLLIGASINQAPELFRVAVLGVPFVDVVPTMIDETIPLTVVEWTEWGNPNEEKFFDCMMSYSPINNVKDGVKYPACLLTGGLHDPRVQFWEPAKFAAELRHKQSGDSGAVCLKMDMAAGHFSASDRYKYYKELAFDYCFMLDQLGLSSKAR